MTDPSRTSHITTYGLKPRRRRLICDWLRANGLDPIQIPEDADIVISDGEIHTEYLDMRSLVFYPVCIAITTEPREAWLND